MSSESNPQGAELHQNHPFLQRIPQELQIRTLTYLRAFDLSAVQLTSRYFNQPELIHAIVTHTSEQVYPANLTQGFADQAVVRSADDNSAMPRNGEVLYTLEHLRNMELLVIARVLNSPEPATGFIVSKSWCKTALKWLEATTNAAKEESNISKSKPKKKVSKKKQRMRARRLSDVSPPWPNVNSDLLCEHCRFLLNRIVAF